MRHRLRAEQQAELAQPQDPHGTQRTREVEPRRGSARDAPPAAAPVHARGRRARAPDLLGPEVMRYVATGPMADIAHHAAAARGLRRPPAPPRLLVLGGDRALLGTLIGDAGLYRTPGGRGRARLHARRRLVGPRVRHRGGRPAGCASRSTNWGSTRSSRWPSRRTPRRCTCSTKLGMRRVGRAHRVRAPARGVPRSAAGEHRLDPVQHALKTELEGSTGSS